MTRQYIAGFFDADGSIYLARNKSNETKILGVSLTNTDTECLADIEALLIENEIKGIRIATPKNKEHHLQSYQLMFQGGNAEKFMSLVAKYICNRKKQKRWKFFNEVYKPLKKRNGKYTDEERKVLEHTALIFNDIKS